MTAIAERPRRGPSAPNPFDYTDFDQEQVLYCRVSLARDWKKELAGTVREPERIVVLDHKRDARTPRRYLRLVPGKSVQMELALAEGFFGRFSIALLDRVGTARTEAQKQALAEEYARTRAHAIVRWGDFPRFARAGSGMTYEPLGPARFPDVAAAIIPAEEDDAKDARYKPARLRDLYELGDFFDAEHLCNPGGFANRVREDERTAKADFAASQMEARLAELQGQVTTLTALLTPEARAAAASVLQQSAGAQP